MDEQRKHPSTPVRVCITQMDCPPMADHTFRYPTIISSIIISLTCSEGTKTPQMLRRSATCDIAPVSETTTAVNFLASSTNFSFSSVISEISSHLVNATGVHTSISHKHQVHPLGAIPANVEFDQFHALHRDFITADAEGREWVLESQEKL